MRELRALVETAVAPAGPAEGAAVGAALLRFAAGEGGKAAPGASGADAPPGMLDAAVAELERRMLHDALEATGGNQSEAARRLGVSRVALIKKPARLGLR